MKPEPVSGSLLWQSVFLSFAVVLLLFQMARGWRMGLPRQLVRLVALLAAYAIALFGGKAALPFLRPLLRAPDFFLTLLGGALMALIVYTLINTVGLILFKRTSQHESSSTRLLFGASGAALGFCFGLFFLWLTVSGLRALGSIGEVRSRNVSPPHASGAHIVADDEPLTLALARLKKSLELGRLGELVRQSDALPGGSYETLSKLGEIVAQPESLARFFSYPGVAALVDHPKLLALRADPQITRMLEEGNLFELLQDDRVIEAANDPELAAQLKKFDLKKALDYAVGE